MRAACAFVSALLNACGRGPPAASFGAPVPPASAAAAPALFAARIGGRLARAFDGRFASALVCGMAGVWVAAGRGGGGVGGTTPTSPRQKRRRRPLPPPRFFGSLRRSRERESTRLD